MATGISRPPSRLGSEEAPGTCDIYQYYPLWNTKTTKSRRTLPDRLHAKTFKTRFIYLAQYQ
jgi:hypothetical protein